MEINGMFFCSFLLSSHIFLPTWMFVGNIEGISLEQRVYSSQFLAILAMGGSLVNYHFFGLYCSMNSAHCTLSAQE